METTNHAGVALAAVALAALAGCVTRPVDEARLAITEQVPLPFLQSTDTEVDLLFVIDNSDSMAEEQASLARNFPKLIEALRSYELGPDTSGRPCTPTDRSGCQIPDLHIGVVSSDLGAGSYTNLPGCTPGGDRGRLQRRPRDATCTPPSDAFIRYAGGETNIPAATGDPIAAVKDAFGCIARLGIGGCGFEHQLESARRALDPQMKLNPGFLRDEALLAVVLITDEDDCSARDAQLFDPSQSTIDDPFGPLHSFRCFEFGFSCDVNDRTRTGPRRDCTPTDRYLYDLQQRYVDFFSRLKPRHRLVVAAIAGPTERVQVVNDGGQPVLDASCQSANGIANPALRIKRVVDAFGEDGHFASICQGDFGPALEAIGNKLHGRIGDQCIPNALLTPELLIACGAGDSYAPGKICKHDSLEQVSCEVLEGRSTEMLNAEPIERCPTQLWYPQDWQKERDCGASCPCWRLVRKAKCGDGSSPYALDILRQVDPPKGRLAEMRCLVAPGAWGTEALAQYLPYEP